MTQKTKKKQHVKEKCETGLMSLIGHVIQRDYHKKKVWENEDFLIVWI